MQADTTLKMVCLGCGLYSRARPPRPGETFKCPRCNEVLCRRTHERLHVPLALVFTGILLFVIANTSPLMKLNIYGKTSQGVVFTGVVQLAENGYLELGVVVFAFTMLLPILKLLALAYLLLPLCLNVRVPGLLAAARLCRHIGSLAMLDIYMLGILVAFTKLDALAQVSAGAGMFAFAGLFLSMTLVTATLDWEEVWEGLEKLECRPKW